MIEARSWRARDFLCSAPPGPWTCLANRGRRSSAVSSDSKAFSLIRCPSTTAAGAASEPEHADARRAAASAGATMRRRPVQVLTWPDYRKDDDGSGGDARAPGRLVPGARETRLLPGEAPDG